MQKQGMREDGNWLVVNGSQGPGRLEVLDPEGAFLIEPCLTVTRLNSSEKMDIIKDSKDKQNGKLPVLGTTEELVIESIETAPRSSRVVAWQGPAGNRKNYAPTKKISLCALKAAPGRNHPRISTRMVWREEFESTASPLACSSSKELAEGVPSTMLSSSRENICAKDMVDKKSNKIPKSATLISCGDKQEDEQEDTQINRDPRTSSSCRQQGETEKIIDKVSGTERPAVEVQPPSTDSHNINEKLSYNTNKDGEDEESSDDLSEKEDEKEGAPIELMGEFLTALMDENYKLASKLCQMILIYEPENPEASQFLPLIEKKLQIEENEQNLEHDEETDEESSDESDDTTSDDSESEEDSEETSDDLSDQDGESGNCIGHNLMGW